MKYISSNVSAFSTGVHPSLPESSQAKELPSKKSLSGNVTYASNSFKSKE